jgi:hypothetical protein
VTDDDGAAGEIEQGVLQRAQRVHVEIVGRLVEEQKVRPTAQQLREVHAIALATGEQTDSLLLVSPLEIEPGHIGA